MDRHKSDISREAPCPCQLNNRRALSDAEWMLDIHKCTLPTKGINECGNTTL